MIDEPDNDNVKFIVNQCASVGTALKMVGDPEWQKVSTALRKWVNDNQSKIKQNPIRNSYILF